VVTWLVAEVFAPTPLPGGLALPAAALKIAVLFGAAAGASALFARLRVDHVRTLLTQTGLLMGLAVVFALIGA
jgi:formate hydrogenlyase subunit 4